MRSFDEHLQVVLADVVPGTTESLPLTEALNRRLAADVHASHPLPRWDNSAMDGYAVRAADLAVVPASLTVIDDIPAGHLGTQTVGAGQAARIMTGAPMPVGADAVVPVEHTDARTDVVTIQISPTPGAHIRRAGEDRQVGEQVASAGELLTPQRLAAVAAAGLGTVEVRVRPRVAIITTGSELVEPGAPLDGASIHDSNGVLVRALVTEAGGVVVSQARSTDDPDDLARRLAEVDADAVILTGGASVGAYDVTKAVLGSTIEFTNVAMQPGKPQGFGRLPDGTAVFALPGNPVSVWVSFHVFVVPWLAVRSAGAGHRPVRATATAAWRSANPRMQFRPATMRQDESGAWELTPVSSAGSHLVATLAAANGYAVVPADVDEVAEGDRVEAVVVSREDAG
jgi:molybdopterin molybdotransferase